jgi:hypothetical protein
MATDKSEPRVGVILKVAVFSIVTLVGARMFLFAYFDRIAQAEEHRKFGEVKPEALLNVRAAEKARLTSGPTPIDQSMQMLATKGRMASPEILPTASRDVAPLQGWSKMPAEVPSPMMAPESDAGLAAQAVVDAGGGAAADGAVPKNNKPNRAHPDSGVLTKPPAKTP